MLVVSGKYEQEKRKWGDNGVWVEHENRAIEREREEGELLEEEDVSMMEVGKVRGKTEG